MADPRAAAQVALVGSESLLGRDVRDVFSTAKPSVKLKLVGSEDPDAAILTAQGGEAVVMTAMDAETLGGADVILLAGSAEATQKAMKLAGAAKRPPAIIDLTLALEDNPAMRLRAPGAEPPGYQAPEAPIQGLAHPAAIVLADFLRKVQGLGTIERSLFHVFEPASERGRAGVDELQKQTVQLLSFQKPVQEVFDAQVSFNLLAQYGSEARESLESVEQRIERHLATLLALEPPAPMPSLRLLQAPVMHGYSFSAWVEFDRMIEREAIRDTFSGEGYDWRGELEPPNVVGMAGLGDVGLGAIEPDRNNPRAMWFWLVADNYQVRARNALALTREVLERRNRK